MVHNDFFVNAVIWKRTDVDVITLYVVIERGILHFKWFEFNPILFMQVEFISREFRKL